MKYLEENIGSNHTDFDLGNDFLGEAPSTAYGSSLARDQTFATAVPQTTAVTMPDP